MWWLIGIGGIGALLMYVGMLTTVGFATLANGRRTMFVGGLVFPMLWLMGAILPPADGY